MKTSLTVLFNHPQYIKNLSSKTALTLLDDFLFEIYSPILRHTHLLDEWIIQMVAYNLQNHRRKLSYLDRDDLTQKLYAAYTTKNPQLIREAKLDRGLLMKLLSDCIAILRDYRSKDEKCLCLDEFSQTCSIIYPTCNAYLDMYLELFHIIQGKYKKLAYREALRASRNTAIFVDKNDIHGNYNLATIRAINKCDAEKGTLTSYIQNWWLNARNNPEFDHEYNTAYKLPSAIRRQLNQKGKQLQNFADKLENAPDSEDEYDPLYRMFHFDPANLKLLQANADKYKEAWLLYNLPYKLNPTQLDQLNRHKVKQTHTTRRMERN